MSKKLMVNMADVVVANVVAAEVATPRISDKERAVLLAVFSNKMSDSASVSREANISKVSLPGVMAALSKKGYMVSKASRFGTMVEVTDAGAEVAALML